MFPHFGFFLQFVSFFLSRVSYSPASVYGHVINTSMKRASYQNRVVFMSMKFLSLKLQLKARIVIYGIRVEFKTVCCFVTEQKQLANNNFLSTAKGNKHSNLV